MKPYLNLVIRTFVCILLISSCNDSKSVKQEDTDKTSVIEQNDPSGNHEKENHSVKNVNFSNFLAGFPNKKIPFNLKNIQFTNYIDDEFVIKFIDADYVKKDSTELAEAEIEDAYTPLKYAYAAKMNMNRKYLLAYYQIRENIGPNGNYTLAVYDTAGKLTDTINFDVFKVYLEASDEVIVYKDSIKVSINNKKHLLNIDEHGRFKNKESLKPD